MEQAGSIRPQPQVPIAGAEHLRDGSHRLRRDVVEQFEGSQPGGELQERSKLRLGSLRPPLCDEELPLVCAPISRIEHRPSGPDRSSFAIRTRRRVQQDSHPRSVGTDDLGRDLLHCSLRREQGCNVGFEVDLITDRHQLRQPQLADDLFAPTVTQPAERVVHAYDDTVQPGRHISAGRLVEAIFGVFLQRFDEIRHGPGGAPRARREANE